jgi:subtilisin family serine protease
MKQTLKTHNLKLERVIGAAEMACMVVKTEAGKLDETENRLKKDSNVCAVQKLFYSKTKVAYHGSNYVPNDPDYPQEWHLAALNVYPAWGKARGRGVTIAVADSGCELSNPDLRTKLLAGVDVTGNRTPATHDIHGHGTEVATTAAAITDNGRLSSSPARDASVFPIRIGAWNDDGSFTASEDSVASALYEAGRRGLRIINISYNNDGIHTFANPHEHPVVWQYLRWYHDQRNGLAFFAAGNSNTYDPNPSSKYCIMVSALGQNSYKASFSNYGNSIYFTAPGENIRTSNMYSQDDWINGTSFASPLAASIAALILSKNANLSNDQVLNIMRRSCINAPGSSWNGDYGYGLPQASVALDLTP